MAAIEGSDGCGGRRAGGGGFVLECRDGIRVVVLISLPITTWVVLIYNFHFDDDVRFFGCFLHHPSSRKLSSRVELLCFQLDAGLEGVCNHEYGSYVSCTAAGIEVLSTRLGVIWQCVKICFWGLGSQKKRWFYT